MSLMIVRMTNQISEHQNPSNNSIQYRKVLFMLLYIGHLKYDPRTLFGHSVKLYIDRDVQDMLNMFSFQAVHDITTRGI